MKVKSVNRGEVTVVNYKDSEVKTGIFKYPVNQPIFLGETDVELDSVVDRKHHGGIDKAVYAYSLDHYPFWKALFPDLDWNYGMFGENLTIENLDESKMHVGAIYSVGKAQIQVCQPRQPCFKLGIRFGTQSVLKLFVQSSYPGIYFRVLKPGLVRIGDELKVVSEELDSPTISEVYSLMYQKGAGTLEQIQNTINCQFLPIGIREGIRKTQAL